MNRPQAIASLIKQLELLGEDVSFQALSELKSTTVTRLGVAAMLELTTLIREYRTLKKNQKDNSPRAVAAEIVRTIPNFC